MAKSIGLTIAAFGFLVLLVAEPVSAQGPPLGWSKGPTLSPYLQMFGRNRGPTNNYFDYVRPRQEMGRYVQEQDLRYQALSGQLQQTQQYQRGLFPQTSPFQRYQTGGAFGQQAAFGQAPGLFAGQTPGINTTQAGGGFGSAGLGNPRGGVGMPAAAGSFQNHNQFFMGVQQGVGGRSGSRGRQRGGR